LRKLALSATILV